MQPLVAPDGLPLWDTFEALLFLLTGVLMGLVFGFLFPSLWRGFRRRMGRALHREDTALSSAELERLPVQPPWLIEPMAQATAAAAQSLLQDELHDGSQDGALADRTASLEDLFLKARALGQSGDWRGALNMLQMILRSPAASSQTITRVHLELAQVYGHLGLLDRALAMAKEYQARRPSSLRALEVTAGLARRCHAVHETLAAVQVFKGNLRSPQARDSLLHITHDLCLHGESLLRLNPGEHVPLLPAQTRDLQTCLSEGERMSPQSLRLQLLRSRRSVYEALQRASSKTEDLWVTLFAELTRQAIASLANPELSAAGLPTLNALLRWLSESPVADNTAVAAAQRLATRDALANTQWRRITTQKKGLARWALLDWTASWPEPLDLVAQPNTLLLRLAEQAFPGVCADLVAQSTASGPPKAVAEKSENDSKTPCLTALRVAITAHLCSRCGAQLLGFSWRCMACGALESLVPRFRLDPGLPSESSDTVR
jgi:hypothetical protein